MKRTVFPCLLLLLGSISVYFCDGSAAVAETEISANNGDDFLTSGSKALSSQNLLGEPPISASKIGLTSFDQGGLVFFLHLPKTGGTTIRRNLENLDRIDYVFGRNYSAYWNEAPKVEDAILHGTKNNTVLFYEIHAKDAPSFYKMRKRLQRWRDTAKHNKIPIFFFSLVRDPLAFSFSHFSFFHVQKRNPSFERCNATEENFARLSLWNPQCQFLFKGELSMRAQKLKQVVVQPDECSDVQRYMWSLLDWVGTTERLSNETLPILEHLLDLPSDFVFESFKVSKESGETFGRENVTSSTINTILEMSSLDTMLYENVQRRYRYSQIDLLKS
jgi:hypothetical protein